MLDLIELSVMLAWNKEEFQVCSKVPMAIQNLNMVNIILQEVKVLSSIHKHMNSSTLQFDKEIKNLVY